MAYQNFQRSVHESFTRCVTQNYRKHSFSIIENRSRWYDVAAILMEMISYQSINLALKTNSLTDN